MLKIEQQTQSHLTSLAKILFHYIVPYLMFFELTQIIKIKFLLIVS